MLLRSRLFGIVGVVTIAGAGVAQPPGGANPPLVDGREPTPIAREFYTNDNPTTAFGTITLPVARAPGQSAPKSVAPLAEFVAGVWNEMLNRLTIPLGAVPVRE